MTGAGGSVATAAAMFVHLSCTATEALHACAMRQSPARSVFSSTCRCALHTRSVGRVAGALGPLLGLLTPVLLLLLAPGEPGVVRAGLPAAAAALRMEPLVEPAGALATKQVVAAPASLR